MTVRWQTPMRQAHNDVETHAAGSNDEDTAAREVRLA